MEKGTVESVCEFGFDNRRTKLVTGRLVAQDPLRIIFFLIVISAVYRLNITTEVYETMYGQYDRIRWVFYMHRLDI